MEIFDVFSINGIENVILKVSQTHFSKDFYPKGGGGGGINFSRGLQSDLKILKFQFFKLEYYNF